MKHALRFRRLRTVSCARCCGASCAGRKRLAVGFAPSMAALIEANAAPASVAGFALVR